MTRVGLGFDAHGFDESRPLVLGGVEIPGSPGLAGHSDADVVTHAIADAILGAAGLGDLGVHFPADERWRDASSLELLHEVRSLAGGEGWSIANIDVTVVAAGPRLSPYRREMARRIADALELDVATVSIKATTTDSLGFTGRGEGMAAMAVALVNRM